MENAIAKFREEIASITYAIVSEIIAIMQKHPGQAADFTELGSSPILLDNMDGNLIVTLDSVEYIPKENKLILFGSNCWSNDYSYTISTNENAFSRHDPYLLSEVLEYLLNYEEDLFDFFL